MISMKQTAMMMPLMVILTIGLVCQVPAIDDSGWRQGPSESWFVNWDKALNRAQETGKVLFLLHTGSDWCTWCQKLKAEVLEQPEFTAFARRNLVLVYLDSPRYNLLDNEQQTHNERILRALPFGNGVPCALVMTPDGEKLGEICGGGMSVDTYLDRLREILATSGDEVTDEDAKRLFTEGYDVEQHELNDEFNETEDQEPDALQKPFFDLDTAQLVDAVVEIGLSDGKCQTAFGEFKDAVAAANAKAIASRDAITEKALRYLQTAMEKAQAAGNLDKVIAIKNAIETIDGELEGDVGEIIKLRDGRNNQFMKISNDLVVSGLNAANSFYAILDQKKKEKTQTGELKTAQEINSVQKVLVDWATETKEKIQSLREPVSRPSTEQAAKPRRNSETRRQASAETLDAIETEDDARKQIMAIKARAMKINVSLDCKLVSSANSTDKDWKTSYGSYSGTKTKSKAYMATVRNSTNEDGKYTLRWFYIGKKDSLRDDIILDKGSKTVTIKSGTLSEVPMPSRSFEGDVEVYRYSGTKRSDGVVKIKGIVVQLFNQDGEIIRAFSSQPSWQNRAWIVPFEF